MENKTILNISRAYDESICINTKPWFLSYTARNIVEYLIRKKSGSIEVSNHTFTDGNGPGDYGVFSALGLNLEERKTDGITLYQIDWMNDNHPFKGIYTGLCNADLIHFFNHIPPNIYIKA